MDGCRQSHLAGIWTDLLVEPLLRPHRDADAQVDIGCISDALLLVPLETQKNAPTEERDRSRTAVWWCLRGLRNAGLASSMWQ